MVLRRSSVFWATLLALQLAAAWARANEHESFLFLGVGLLGLDSGRIAASQSGAKSLLSGLNSTLCASFDLRLGHGISLIPAIAYPVLSHAGPEGGSSSSLMPITLSLGKRSGLLQLSLGAGELFYTVGGNGGSVTLNNGTSTQSFPLPNSSQTSTEFLLAAGLGAFIHDFRLALDATLANAFTPSRRGLNLMVSMSYGLL